MPMQPERDASKGMTKCLIPGWAIRRCPHHDPCSCSKYRPVVRQMMMNGSWQSLRNWMHPMRLNWMRGCPADRLSSDSASRTCWECFRSRMQDWFCIGRWVDRCYYQMLGFASCRVDCLGFRCVEQCAIQFLRGPPAPLRPCPSPQTQAPYHVTALQCRCLSSVGCAWW